MGSSPVSIDWGIVWDWGRFEDGGDEVEIKVEG